MYRERPLGQIIEVARKLSVDERLQLAHELNLRIRAAQAASGTIVSAAVAQPQVPTAAEP
jgi:hypothetical protein